METFRYKVHIYARDRFRGKCHMSKKKAKAVHASEQTLEQQYKILFGTPMTEEDWSQVTNLEQPSPFETVDSVGMPNADIDPALHAYSGQDNAKLA